MATQIQGRASVLESEIKQDAGKGNTEKKEEELAELQAKAQSATAAQMSTLADANKSVEEATKGLTEKPAPEVNKDALKAAIEKAEDVLENLEDAYTPESVEALKGALETAKGVFDNADAVQAEVDQAAEAIETAISGLTVKPAPEADKTALKAVCEFLLPSIPQKSIIFKINIHLSFDFVVY